MDIIDLHLHLMREFDKFGMDYRHMRHSLRELDSNLLICSALLGSPLGAGLNYLYDFSFKLWQQTVNDLPVINSNVGTRGGR